MIKFIIALLFLLIVAIIAGMVRKLRGGSFLPHDGLVMDMKTGQWRRRCTRRQTSGKIICVSIRFTAFRHCLHSSAT